MTDTAAARSAIERRSFVGWVGLPAALVPAELFPVLGPDQAGWAQRALGDEFAPTAFKVLELPGYYRPTVSARDGAVVLFDGMNPELDGGLSPLAEDLGQPAELLDYDYGTLPVRHGEWPYPERGISLFVNTTADRALHVAVYPPATFEDYLRRVRPHLGKKLRPVESL